MKAFAQDLTGLFGHTIRCLRRLSRADQSIKSPISDIDFIRVTYKSSSRQTNLRACMANSFFVCRGLITLLVGFGAERPSYFARQYQVSIHSRCSEKPMAESNRRVIDALISGQRQFMMFLHAITSNHPTLTTPGMASLTSKDEAASNYMYMCIITCTASAGPSSLRPKTCGGAELPQE